MKLKMIVLPVLVGWMAWVSYCVIMSNRSYVPLLSLMTDRIILLQENVKRLDENQKGQLELNRKLLLLEARRQGLEQQAVEILKDKVPDDLPNPEQEQRAYEARRAARDAKKVKVTSPE